jgi:myo-inositol 2-dehydrogenase / D-chiro-inositol 1-dehydrogenase
VTVCVGVIGTGIMGADHVTTLHRYVRGAALGMVADVDLARAEAVAAEVPGVRASDDASAVIGDARVDAVIISSHDSTHADLAVAAVEAGKPVMCEKPLAPTVSECIRIVEAERKATGVGGSPLVSVGYMRRFDPGYAEMKAALEAGACGTPRVAHCVSRGVSSGPGVTNEVSVTQSAIHEFDVLPWLLGTPIVEVSWHAPRSAGPVPGLDDPQVMLLRTADGALTTLEVFLNARYGYDIRCEIVGDRGTLALANPARVIADLEGRRSAGYPADWRPRFADAYRLQLQAWIDAVAAGRPTPLATASEGLAATAVADAVIASMHDGGRAVPVEVAAPE